MSDTAAGLRWAAAAMLAALACGTYGWLLNDEQDQASAFYAVASGSLFVNDRPEQFYRVSQSLHIDVRYPGPIPVGSTLLNFLALPLLAVVRVATLAMPLWAWLSAVALALCWSLLPPRLRPFGAWTGILAFAAVSAGFRGRDPDLGLFDTVVALQLTNILLFGATAFFLGATLRRLLPAGPAGLVGTAALAGPLLFWSWHLKYTALAACLAAALLWLATQPPSATRNAAAGLVAALAVWNNIGEGIVAFVAAGTWLLVDLLRTRPTAWRTWLAGPVALVAGLVPWMMENQVLRGNPLAASYLFSNDGAALQASERPFLVHVMSQAFAADLWRGPVDFLVNLVDPLTVGAHTESLPLGVFAISPLLAWAVWGLLRGGWWRQGPTLVAALLFLAHAAFLTNRVVRQGAGNDARLLAPILPAVAVLAAAGLTRLATLAPEEVRAVRRWAAASAGLAIALLLAATAWGPLGYGLKSWPIDRTLLLAWLGVSAALLAAAAALVVLRLLAVPGRKVLVAGVGLALAMPVLWTFVAVFESESEVASAGGGQPARGMLPAAETLRQLVDPAVRPTRLPIVTEDGYTVFHPSYGYCDADPSPCPWGARGNATAA